MATLTPWGMVDVFMLGILVSVVKLADMATIVPETSLFAFVVLIFVLAAAQASLDGDIVWSRVPVADRVHPPPRPGKPIGACHVCELVMPEAETGRVHGRLRCPCCSESLHKRKPDRACNGPALVIAAIVCYLPANLLPTTTVISFGKAQLDTIMSGVIYLFSHSMWPLGLSSS